MVLRFSRIVLFVVIGSLAAVANAGYDSNGFESPTFTVGTLDGQDGWVAGAPNSVVVTAGRGVGGSNAATVTYPNGTQSSFAERADTGSPGSFFVEAKIKLASDWLAGWSTGASYSALIAVGVNGNSVIECGFVKGNAIDGLFLAGPLGATDTNQTQSTSQLLNAYHTLRLDWTQGANSGLATVTFDGNVAITHTYANGATVTSVQIPVFGGNRMPATGPVTNTTVDFDDFRFSSPVPEPASLAALSLGFAGFLRGRSQRASSRPRI